MENIKYKKFNSIRKKVLKEVEKQTLLRIKKNPKPTEEEIYIGAFREMLEPQIKDAIFKLYKKGYSTESSGFYGDYGEKQCVDGYFHLDTSTKEKLKKNGVSVLDRVDLGYPGASKMFISIQFYPTNYDLLSMKKKWDKIAKIIPQKDTKAPPSTSGGAEEFIKKYAPDRKEILIQILQRRLDLDMMHPKFINKTKNNIKKLREDK